MSDTTATRRRRKTYRPPIDVQLTLGSWAARGGVEAEHEGRMVTIDRGIPGERVHAEVDRHRKPCRGVVRKVLSPSVDRVEPPCQYFAAGCGGCQWQHVSYDAQLAAKRALIDREMERNGVAARVSEIHGMEQPWRYRHTAAIAIGWEAGFRPRARRGIIEIRDCPISHELIGQLADALNDLLRAGKLPNYHGKVWLDCTVVGGESRPSIQVLVQGIEGLSLETHPELTTVARTISEIGFVSSVAFRHRSGEPRPIIGDLMSRIDVLGRPMWLPAGSFFQNNITMLEMLIRRLRVEVRDRSPSDAADIYGGAGTFALHLGDLVKSMLLVELDPLAVDAARRTALDWGRTNLSVLSRHAERALPELEPLDLIIVDPPRSGLGSTVTDAISRNGAHLVLYVSCAPGSLAVDLAALQALGYHVQNLEAFDFYPQTYHVESLAVLQR